MFSVILVICFEILLAQQLLGQQTPKWYIKLEFFNSGRIFLADANWDGKLERFGPICMGTGRFALMGSNGKNFGRTVCSELGLDFKFVGGKEDYLKFMGKNVTLADECCIANYQIAGGKCRSCKFKKEKCSLSKNCPVLRDYEREGGTCLRGKSDIYVHCGMKKENQKKTLTEIGQNLAGQWTEWDTPIPCYGNNPFSQSFRTCQSEDNKSNSRAFCKGRWMKLMKCKNKVEENENYNLYANYEYDYSSYSQ